MLDEKQTKILASHKCQDESQIEGLFILLVRGHKGSDQEIPFGLNPKWLEGGRWVKTGEQHPQKEKAKVMF